jgi:hypothetical protein
MVDLLMQICLEAGRGLADPLQVPTVPPGALADQAAREKLVQAVQDGLTADINAARGMLIPSVMACVRGDRSLTGAAAGNLPGLPPDVAAGVAMRFYDGFLDMAKTLRMKSITGATITPRGRATFTDAIHQRARLDQVYAAGVRFGWWGIERPGRPENVVDDGISPAHKQLYLADYYQEKQPPAVSPPKASGP